MNNWFSIVFPYVSTVKSAFADILVPPVPLEFMAIYVAVPQEPETKITFFMPPGDGSPHGGILLLLCPYVCMFVCLRSVFG